jgi:probable phosphoglycerate mutase
VGRLILVRHAESEGNRDRVFTRSPAVPITERGRAQAQAVGSWIEQRARPSVIVTRPFVRARQTADILAAALGVPVVVEPDLREQSYGEMAGQPYGTLREAPGYDPHSYWEWRPPAGETLVEVAARAGSALDRLVHAHPSDDVVVVSHGGVMAALWRHVTGAWRPGRVVPNAGIVLVEHQAGVYLQAHRLEEIVAA